MSTAIKVRVLTSVVSLIEGYDIGVVNGAVMLFKDELDLVPWQVGVVLSIFPFGVAMAALLGGFLGDRLGRKPTMCIATFLFIVGGCIMGLATGFKSMALGRITAGSGTGLGIATVTAYMSEVAPAHDRGFYGSLEELFVNIGNMTGYIMNMSIMGMPYDWRIMLFAGAVPAFFVLIVLLLPYSISGIPESPRFLEKVGRKDEAREVLIDLLRGDVEEAERAFQSWTHNDDGEGLAEWPETLHAFSTTHRKEAVAGVGVGILNNFTGMQLMMVYSTLMLASAGMDKHEAMMVTMFLGAIKASVMLVVALFFLDTWGRIPLLQGSLSICAIGALVGLIANLFSLGDVVEVAGLAVFVTGFSVGVGPVPWVYMPEVLPSRYRAKGCSMGLCGSRLGAVTQLLVFPLLLPYCGMEGVFLFLLTINALSLVFVSAVCPETMGLTLEQMKTIFDKEKDVIKSA